MLVRGNTMKTLGLLIGWAALAASCLYMLFAPRAGLLDAGPGVCLGLCLLGGAVARFMSESNRASSHPGER